MFRALFLGSFLLLTPLTTNAFGPIVTCGFDGTPCTACHFFALISHALVALVALTSLIIILAIMWAGVRIATAAGNVGTIKEARSMLTNSIVGLLIILCSWLIINTVMHYFVKDDAFGGRPWNTISADECRPPEGSVQPTPPTSPGGGETTPPTSGGNEEGTCSIPTSGMCAPSALSGFGAEASQAAQICFAESSGIPTMESRSDKMRNDPQHRSFSIGLFQINLTYHEVGGLNCPSAFNGKNYSATVRDENLYNRCVAAAKDPNLNIAEAVRTWNASGQSFSAWSTAKKCHISLAPFKTFVFLPYDIRYTTDI